MPARISGWRVDERVEEGRGLHSRSLWQLSGMQLFLGKASSWRGTKTQCFTRLDSVTASLVCYWKIIYCHLSSKADTTLPHKVLLLSLTSAYSSASSQNNGWRWRLGQHGAGQRSLQQNQGNDNHSPTAMAPPPVTQLNSVVSKLPTSSCNY